MCMQCFAHKLHVANLGRVVFTRMVCTSVHTTRVCDDIFDVALDGAVEWRSLEEDSASLHAHTKRFRL